MSVVKTNSLQLGQSLTATNNFTWYQPATPDGTVRLGNGNSGSVTDLVTLTSAGNLGIGTSSPSASLSIAGSSTNGTTGVRITNSNASGFSTLDLQNSGASGRSYSIGVGGNTAAANANALYFYDATAAATRLTLDSSGNLGLGVTPSAWGNNVSVFQGAIGGHLIFNKVNGETALGSNGYYNGSSWIYATSAPAARYAVNGYNGTHAWSYAPSGTAGNAISFTQAMTLDASGNLLVGVTSNQYTGAGYIQVANNIGVKTAISAVTASTGNVSLIEFRNPNGTVGSINTSVSSTIYNTSSDQRLKTNIIPAGSAIQSILDFPVDQFDWISSGEHQDFGAVAQKAINFIPEMVSVPADPEEMWGIDWSKAVPRLIRAIQELSAELNELKKKVNA